MLIKSKTGLPVPLKLNPSCVCLVYYIPKSPHPTPKRILKEVLSLF